MIDYSKANGAFVEQFKKEIWTQGEMTGMTRDLNQRTIRSKYGLKDSED